MTAQIKFVLFVFALLFIASAWTAAYLMLGTPINRIGFGIALFFAIVFYIGFVNTLMEVE